MVEKDVEIFADGDVRCWVEQDASVMLKAVTGFRDPVELTARECREIGEAHLRMARVLDQQ